MPQSRLPPTGSPTQREAEASMEVLEKYWDDEMTKVNILSTVA